MPQQKLAKAVTMNCFKIWVPMVIDLTTMHVGLGIKMAKARPNTVRAASRGFKAMNSTLEIVDEMRILMQHSTA